MRAILKRSRAVLGLKEDLQSLRRKYLSGQKSAIDRYIASARTPSLHIGAYRSHIPGWLDTDVAPADAETIYLDATKPFPIASCTFKYIYSEHMIEHVPLAAGLRMLRECRRVLRADGVLRLATPDLAFLLSLYFNPGVDGRSYMTWIADTCMTGKERNEVTAADVINIAFNSWGHQFLYDFVTLESSLRKAGFTKISRVKYNESSHESLRGIEQHGRALGNIDIAILETMICEAS